MKDMLIKTPNTKTSLFSELVCSECGKSYDASLVNSFSPCCKKPLLAVYHVNDQIPKEIINTNDASLWRYTTLLPVFDKENIVSLGEGFTPVLALEKLAAKNNLSSVVMKDEAFNPTGSFKARGISLAVSKAKELGIRRLIIPTAGNAGGALAAYCAKADMKCTVVMPEHTPAIFKDECRLFGAELILIKGLINDCAQKVEEIRSHEDYFDVSTLKEPYRLEGKKTMGYEIAEQLDWCLPDVIVYPAGGGTGLIGIWKAFQEMQKMGWINGPLPRMVAVQAENCAPLAAAMENPSGWKESFKAYASLANGLAVPYPFGIQLMQQVIYASEGEVVTVSEEEIVRGIEEVANTEGVLLSPEGSAAWMGIKRLLQNKRIDETEKVLFLNTGSSYKYLESLKSFF